MLLFYTTNDPEEAVYAASSGVDRIFVDTETLGKATRQKGKVQFLADHKIEDVKPIRKALQDSEILVRINSVHEHTKREVDSAIEYGASMIMLPYFKTKEEVEYVADLIGGRVGFIPLLETDTAMARIDEILDVKGITEMYVGLNDLSISLGLSFLFEVLGGGLLDWMADKINSRGIPWGFGGVARVGEGALPAEYILRECHRLGATRVILSYLFRSSVKNSSTGLPQEIDSLRRVLDEAKSMTPDQIEENRIYVSQKAREIAKTIERNKLS